MLEASQQRRGNLEKSRLSLSKQVPGTALKGALKGGGQEENGRGPQRLGSKDAAGQQEKSPFAPMWMTNSQAPTASHKGFKERKPKIKDQVF